ncbi:unnamed protein product [Cylicocyclus nassatus]|uniref:non-specific serine/threonine protein kinase n=1 Tax=Cylicocyclus nassatus TaxID=53992 RepID=A0AA36H0Q6_CYLNA|nr:unnamed protein product [Cylicocyclus nassatus]
MGKKKRRKSRKEFKEGDEESGSESDSSSMSEKSKQEVLPVAAKKTALPGAILKARRQPPWYFVRILEEERPDLLGPNGKLNLEKEDAILMDMFIRDKSDLMTGDLIITDDNLDEEDRHFNRYEVQLKYNEGRYTALYLISRQICANNELEEKGILYAMKTSLRPNSANIVLRMKRELRILNELKKCNCPYSPVPLDSGRVADLPFIVMNLLDRNLEKLREQTAAFRPSTAFYVAYEVLSALSFLHVRKYVHRDVKMTNICIGARPALNRIYLIDYGDTVKFGKRIRYGTPDIYTLPYWSMDAHKRAMARERGDAESWFYVLAELIKPGCLPWLKLNSEVEVLAAKEALWKEGGQNLVDNPHMILLQELIQYTTNRFDHDTAKAILRDGIESNRPLSLEWIPVMRISLPPAPRTSFAQLKERVASIKGLSAPSSDKTQKAKDTPTRTRDESLTQRSSRPGRMLRTEQTLQTLENLTQRSSRKLRRKPDGRTFTEASREESTMSAVVTGVAKIPPPRKASSARKAGSMKRMSPSKMMPVSASKMLQPIANKMMLASKGKMLPPQPGQLSTARKGKMSGKGKERRRVTRKGRRK